MDPITIASGVMAGVGVGMQLFGMNKQQSAQKEMSAAQQQLTQMEFQQEGVRMRAMELDARRRSLEMLRNTQRARAMALVNANSQGAIRGSGLQGGYGQIAAAGAWNAMGVNQALLSGRENFAISAQMSNQKILLQQAQSRASEGAGLMSMGGSLLSAMPHASKFAGGFNAPRSPSLFDPTFGGTTGGVGMSMTGGIGSA